MENVQIHFAFIFHLNGARLYCTAPHRIRGACVLYVPSWPASLAHSKLLCCAMYPPTTIQVKYVGYAFSGILLVRGILVGSAVTFLSHHSND